MSKINNIAEIISLGSILMANTGTQSRGAALLVDLADELLPEKVVTGGTTVRTGLPPEAVAGQAKIVAAPIAAPISAPVAAPISAPVAAPIAAPVAAPAVPSHPSGAPGIPATMTPEELNNALVVEFRRLGSREAIDNAMAELGAANVTALQPEQYSVLLAKVQGIK